MHILFQPPFCPLAGRWTGGSADGRCLGGRADSLNARMAWCIASILWRGNEIRDRCGRLPNSAHGEAYGSSGCRLLRSYPAAGHKKAADHQGPRLDGQSPGLVKMPVHDLHPLLLAYWREAPSEVGLFLNWWGLPVARVIAHGARLTLSLAKRVRCPFETTG